MVNTMLAENQDMIPEDSIVVKTKLSIPSPKEYSGSPDLEVYETFIAGILRWLRLNGLLGEDNTDFQVEYWEQDSRVVHLSGTLEMSKDMTNQFEIGHWKQ